MCIRDSHGRQTAAGGHAIQPSRHGRERRDRVHRRQLHRIGREPLLAHAMIGRHVAGVAADQRDPREWGGPVEKLQLPALLGQLGAEREQQRRLPGEDDLCLLYTSRCV